MLSFLGCSGTTVTAGLGKHSKSLRPDHALESRWAHSPRGNLEEGEVAWWVRDDEMQVRCWGRP